MNISDIIEEEFDAAKAQVLKRIGELLMGGGQLSGAAAAPSPRVAAAQPRAPRPSTSKPSIRAVKEEFDNEVLQWIDEHPGSYGVAIANAFGCESMKIPLIANSMSRLKTRGALIKKGASNATVYYKNGSANKSAAVPITLTKQTRKTTKKNTKRRSPEENQAIRGEIIEYLANHPDSGGGEIAIALNIKSKDAGNFAESMVNGKELRRRKVKGRVLYRNKAA